MFLKFSGWIGIIVYFWDKKKKQALTCHNYNYFLGAPRVVAEGTKIKYCNAAESKGEY